MSWFFGPKTAHWELGSHQEQHGPMDYVFTIAWLLKDEKNNEISYFTSPQDYAKEQATLKRSYSFPELTAQDWATLKQKQEVHNTNQQAQQRAMAEKQNHRAVMESARKAEQEATALEKKKADCRALLATGGRRRKTKRRRTKKSRRHR
jgi:hypothetical protein